MVTILRVELTDFQRRAIRHHSGKKGLATREDIIKEADALFTAHLETLCEEYEQFCEEREEAQQLREEHRAAREAMRKVNHANQD